MGVVPPFHLDFTVSGRIEDIGLLPGETITEARASFIEHAREEVNRALERTLFPLEFKVIDTEFIPDL